MNDLVIRGSKIAQDSNGFFSLTDIWKLSGEKLGKQPAAWRRLPTTQELAAALVLRFSQDWLEATIDALIYTKRGNGAGTFAHIILAVAYAEYLNPALGIEVREIALRVWAGDFSVLDDFKRGQTEQMQEDYDRVLLRGEIKRYNFDLNALVKDAGAKLPVQWANFHNFGYKEQYNGETEDDIHRRKGLKRKQAILDYMCFDEMIANMFRVSQTRLRLRRNPGRTFMEACQDHAKIGRAVRAFMKKHGGIMPEDMPNVDSISDARKRIKNYARGRGLK